MKVEIDISQKLEENNDTYIAIGGAFEFAIKLPKKEKASLNKLTQQKENKRRKKARSKKRQRIKVYGILCYLLIMQMPKGITHVLVDRDYFGHAEEILAVIITLAQKNKTVIDHLDIHFGDASKGSAHLIANATRLEERKLDLIVTAKEIMQYY